MVGSGRKLDGVVLAWCVACAIASPAIAGVTVTVSPPSASVAPNSQTPFKATVAGTTKTAVTWLVNGIRGGAPSIGTISATGVYTAPADVPSQLAVAVEAQSNTAPLFDGSAAVTVAASADSGPRFHVATTGKDSNPGSAAKPWLTIQHAVDTVPAGATILVHGGVYNKLVTITRSGSAKAGFTSLVAAPGETPVIDGTGLGIPGGENGLITISDASYVRVDGFELRNYTSHSTALDPVGIYVVGSGSHIELSHNHIHDIVTTVTSSAGDALGMAIYGSKALTDLIIDSNELDHLTTGFSESLAISGNVTGWQVTNNLIHDNDNIGIDIAGFEKVSPNAALDYARNGLVANNTVYNITSKTNPAYGGQLGADGIYVDGGASITIQQNLVHDTDIGIEMASEHKGHVADQVIARNNVIYLSPLVGMSIGGYGNGVGGTTNCTITNNTLYENDTSRSGSGEFQIQFHASNNQFFNNILFANSQGLLINSFVSADPAPAALDDNLYDAVGGAGNAQFVWLNKSYSSLASFQTKTGNDARSKFASPAFTNAAKFDFTLTAKSPAIDAGSNLGLTKIGPADFAGNPRLTKGKLDIGAYQD